MAVTTSLWRIRFSLITKIVTLALFASFVSTPAVAQKLYKVVDEKGNISYQDTPPMDESLKVEEKHVDISASKLRRDPPPSATRTRPNTGTRRTVAAPSRPAPSNGAPAAPPSSAGQSNNNPFDQPSPFNQGPDSQPKAGFVPASSADLRQHFDDLREQSDDIDEGEGNNNGKPLSTDELSEIVRQIK